MRGLRLTRFEYGSRSLDPRLRRSFVQSVVLLGLLSSPLLAADPIDFNQQIRPLFKERCYECHGPDKQESGLRLDKRQEALAGGDSGAAIIPGDVASGLLLKYVQSEDAELVMPPKGDRLTEEQIKLLKQWIEEGAEWPQADSPDRQSGHPIHTTIWVGGNRRLTISRKP